MTNKRRVVVTGLGIVAPNGIGKDEFWKANVEGISGTNLITSFNCSDYASKVAAEIINFDPSKYLPIKLLNITDRFTQLALAAAQMAIEDSGLIIEKEDRNRIGVYMGSGFGGMFFYESQLIDVFQGNESLLSTPHNVVKKIVPWSVPRITPNAPASQISIMHGLLGPNVVVSTACSSSSHALGLAAQLIQLGGADTILAGGTESPITPLTFGGFNNLRVMSTRNDNAKEASRPFDKERDGFVMGEGAALLVLEELSHARTRNANIYAELIGYSSTSGGYHMVAPKQGGEDAARVMQLALHNAKVNPENVDYINAHGTSTKANDNIETGAIKQVFKKHSYELLVSSTKSMIGHLIGAAAAVEAVVTVLAIKNNIAPPTINYTTPDPECDLNYVPNQAQKRKIDVALSNSFGFGNNNSALVFSKLLDN